ncbi:Pentatricopeptide repeat protein [Penicillium brevicompactum]|uniref:Pentatricopeptide repeat protein n=1 Tax=Penicillium brevicompactum TaxID=5074 RepID=A0A9W9Q1I0_PENBR|nr:Pentatricopeptide repeat protein [Penicillium brevicompactum]
MLAHAAKTPSIVPSRNALRVLRQLALAGSTVGGFCTVAVLTYEAHRRVRVAEKIIDNKRTLHNTAPNYDATSAAKRLKVMVEAAEAGEFMGIESLKARNRNLPDGPLEPGSDVGELEAAKYPKRKPMISLQKHHARFKHKLFTGYRKQIFSESTPFHAGLKARNERILARERKQAADAKGDGKLPFEAEVRKLIDEDREITAANLFLAATAATNSISWERREIGCYIFTANCTKGNLFVARTLFNRLDKVSVVSNEMWATIMHLLAKEGHIDSVGAIYDRFRTSFLVPTHLLEVILRCLIESKRLESAKYLFFQRFRDDRDCGLCGAYLDGIWRKTRSMELVSSQLQLIVNRLESLDRKPTEKLFNPVIKAMVETGRAEEAEALVTDMLETYGAKPGCRTIGLIMYSRALACEWDRVMDGMQAMHEHGYTSDKKDFAIAFDRVFLEYYPTHTGSQIFDFLVSCINDFDLKPDRVLHRHILEALIEKGTEEMLTTITVMAEEGKWDTGLDHNEIRDLVKTRRLAMTDSPVGIWRMMQTAKNGSLHSASTRRIFGTSSESWTVRGEKIAPIHLPAEKSYSKTLDMMATKSANLFIPLHQRMQHCINMGKHDDALRMYNDATNAGFVVRPIHLTLATIAALLGHSKLGLANARRLICSEWDYWKMTPSLRYTKRFTSWTPMFFQRVMRVDPAAIGRGGLLKMALFEYYNVCARTDGLAVKHFSAASSSRQLITGGAPEVAVDLLTTIYQSRWRISHGFDQVLLKMLMRAYASLGNLKGVWWCILTMLSRTETIKRDFVVEAKDQMNTLAKGSLSTASDEATEQFKILQNTVEVLEAKSKGDSHWSTISVRPDLKKSARAQRLQLNDQAHLIPTTSLEELILSFDEERELDRLLQRKQFDAVGHAKWWAESHLCMIHSASPEDPIYPETKDLTWDQYYPKQDPKKYAQYHLEFTPSESEDHAPSESEDQEQMEYGMC